jgi:hypothetical protein
MVFLGESASNPPQSPFMKGGGMVSLAAMKRGCLSPPFVKGTGPARHREPARSGEAGGGIFPGQGTPGFGSNAPYGGHT